MGYLQFRNLGGHADETGLLSKNADVRGFFFGTQIGEIEVIFKILYVLYSKKRFTSYTYMTYMF